jgi:hypothetical protein
MRTAFVLFLFLCVTVLTAAAADVTGTWNFEVNTGSGAGNPTFTFKQQGNKLTGTYSGVIGEAPLTGTVEGNKIVFKVKANMNGESVEIAYEGTVESVTSMKGTAVYPQIGEATWVAKKSQ